MVNRIHFRSKLGFGVVLLLIGLLAGLLAFFAANTVLFRDNTMKVEKVTEKQVYLENSANISAIQVLSDSLVTIVSVAQLDDALLTSSSLPGLCLEKEQLCREMGILLTTDGLILYGSTRQRDSVDQLRAIDYKGNLFGLESVAEIDGFSLMRLVRLEEMVLSPEKRTKFFNIKPMMINDLSGLALGQRLLIIKEKLGAAIGVGEGMISKLIRLDQYKIDTSTDEGAIKVWATGLDFEGQALLFDLGGQLIAMRNDEGELLKGDEILAALNRYVLNKTDVSVVNLGFRCVRIDKELSENLKLAVDYGCLVANDIDEEYQIQSGGLNKGGVAEKLGVKEGDVVLEVDNKSLLNISLVSILMNKAYGEAIQLTVLRNGKSLNLKGTL